ncbi:MAG: hypothetical protein K5777_06025 [Nitrosopumilus sp.]|nr:hypothetical protein [Nitrosopumilus sp.]
MDFDETVRFAAVTDENGNILWNSQRTGLKNIVPVSETKQTILRALHAWKENSGFKKYLGSGLYTVASYEKIKRITVPLDNGKMLFCSVSNEPLKSAISKKKSYGHLADMGKILSIVDFIKSQK